MPEQPPRRLKSVVPTILAQTIAETLTREDGTVLPPIIIERILRHRARIVGERSKFVRGMNDEEPDLNWGRIRK
jgi:hypothetical protein